ncbi:hypothetical protein FN846DRAFT_886167 [Sphaerosporella brunnea]|uniref:Uncharacterized protein n=1 Tax=Sphaerosporella brunnea TaxID=1250544 RepID=A0A5J5FA04_9PEZI|nr:hypothetical protein FN846DRAFT_886167 [Sphaerosporella brunnea]
MQSIRWIHHCFATAQQLPQVGELVMLSFSAQQIKFPHGPRSTYCPSVHASHARSACSATLTAGEKRWHLALVTFVTRYDHREQTLVSFLPIVSYSERPAGFSAPTWNADTWMRNDATEVQKLYHLPIPASRWCPQPNPHPHAPAIAFTDWINDRPSWLAVASSTVFMSDSDETSERAHNDMRRAERGDGHPGLQRLRPASGNMFYVEIPDSFDAHAVVFNSACDEDLPPPLPGSSGPDDDCIPDDWLRTFDPGKARQAVADWCASLGEDVGVAAPDNADTGEFSMLQEIAVGEEACMGSMVTTDAALCETCIAVRGLSVSASVVCLCGARCDESLTVTDDDGELAEITPD